MDIIQVMNDQLSNKIAAGEVVERPASIVKELVENAIDAESTVIEVSLEEAGLQTIRVTDNGNGMSRQDAVRAFERHATSKILNEHDLFRIRTLGFRGEALASIAAVSKVRLWTSDGETEGTEVELDGGKLVKHSYAAFRKGTDLTISQLFFNTPARLKYMKTIPTELSHSIDIMNRLALAHPHIAFRLTHHSQQLLKTSGSGEQRRVIADIYGMDVARKMLPFEDENADFHVKGFISLPEVTRATKRYCTLLVNGRWVKSYPVVNALIDAFHTYLPIGRLPIAIINVTADPMLTDVNVHPSKEIIRMSKENQLVELLTKAVRTTLENNRSIPQAVKKERSPMPVSEQVNIWTELEQKKEKPISSFVAQPSVQPKIDIEKVQPLEKEVPLPEQVHEAYAPPIIETEPISTKREFPNLVPVGQVHGTYIIAQNEDGFYMIDQHAAQERIKYEYFLHRLGNVDHDERQLLLMPLIFHYNAAEQTRIEEHKDTLEQVGIYLEEFGPSSYTVKEYPIWFPANEASEIIEEMIELAMENRSIQIGKLREETAIMMSCKKSIKANHYLSYADMEKLLQTLREAENPYTCPHGRPVFIHFSTYEIEKMFKRVM